MVVQTCCQSLLMSVQLCRQSQSRGRLLAVVQQCRLSLLIVVQPCCRSLLMVVQQCGRSQSSGRLLTVV